MEMAVAEGEEVKQEPVHEGAERKKRKRVRGALKEGVKRNGASRKRAKKAKECAEEAGAADGGPEVISSKTIPGLKQEKKGQKKRKHRQDKEPSRGKPLEETVNQQPTEEEIEARKEDLQNRVHVGGLPALPEAEAERTEGAAGSSAKALAKALKRHFSVHGKVKRVELIFNSRLIFRCSAFVVFADKDSATASLAMDGMEYEGTDLKVKMAAPPVEVPSLQVYVGQIPHDADEPTLRKDFGDCGEISAFRMIMDQSTGDFKGAVLVTYVDQAGVEAAMKFDGSEYGGRTLSVRLADKGAKAANGVSKGNCEGKGKGSGKGKGKGKGKGDGQRKGKGKGKSKAK